MYPAFLRVQIYVSVCGFMDSFRISIGSRKALKKERSSIASRRDRGTRLRAKESAAGRAVEKRTKHSHGDRSSGRSRNVCTDLERATIRLIPSPGSGSRLPHAESSRAAFRNQSTAGRCHCKASETQGISDCSSAPAAAGRCIPAADNRCPPEPDYVDIWRRVRTSDLVVWISLGPTPGFSAPSKRRGISRLEPGPF